MDDDPVPQKARRKNTLQQCLGTDCDIPEILLLDGTGCRDRALSGHCDRPSVARVAVGLSALRRVWGLRVLLLCRELSCKHLGAVLPPLCLVCSLGSRPDRCYNPRVCVPGEFFSLKKCLVLVLSWSLCSFIPGTLVSHVTLRLMKPECELDESWCQEELPTALNRVVSLLHAHTIPSRAGKGEPGKKYCRSR